MNIFTRMRQSLLFSAALLCAGGTFAQEAEYGVVWSQDFENEATYAEGWTLGKDVTQFWNTRSDGSHFMNVKENLSGDRDNTYQLTSQLYLNADDWMMEFDWAAYASNTNNSVLTIYGEGDVSQIFTATIPSWASSPIATIATSTGESIASLTVDAHNSSTRGQNCAVTIWYHFKLKGNANGVTLEIANANGEVILEATKVSDFTHATGFNLRLGKALSQMALDDIMLLLPGASEGISTPTCSITGTYENSRTVTITAGVGTEGTQASGTYYTIDGSEPTAESSLYEGPFTISESCTIKIISYLPDGTASEICEFAAEAGFAWPLNVDVVKVADLVGEEDVKNPVIANSYTNTGVLGEPEVSFSYTFNGEEVTLPYTVTEDGALVATATADGYASATETLEVKASYIATRSIDFAAMSQEFFVENYGETWADITEGVRLANWSKSYTYYGTTLKGGYTFDNFVSCSGSDSYPLHMIFGSGVGRGTGSTYTIVGGTEGDIAIYEMNESLAPTENYVKYVIPYMEDSKMSRAASGSQTVAKVTLYSPARELVVEDGKDLAASGTYTSASYVREFNTDYTYGTICLPFAPDAATCANYTFYKLKEVNSEVMYFEEEAEPKANTAYLYKLNDGVDAEVAKTFTGGVTTISDIVTEPVGGWQFIGSFAKTEITDLTGGDYWAYQAEYKGKKDVLVKAGTKLVAHPYRAYFKFVPTEEVNFTPAAATMRMIIGGKEGGAMEIQEVIAPEQVEGAAFDLEGRPVQEMQKGQIYIIGGKKVKK